MALLAYVFFRYDTDAVFLRLRQAQLHWLVIAWALFYAAILLSSLKWKSILHTYGHQAPLRRLFGLYIEAGFLNLFFPGFVAGDISRIARTSGGDEPYLESAFAVFLERFSGLLIACLYIGSVALLGGYEVLGRAWHSAILLAIVLVLGGLVLLLNIRWVGRIIPFLPHFIGQHVEKMAAKVHHAVGRVTSHPMLLWKLAVLSLLFVLISVPAAYFVARSINFSIPVHVLLAYVPLTALLSNLPISIGGIGVRENICVFLYSALGFLPEDIIAFSLSLSCMLLVVNLSGGVLLLLRSAHFYLRPK